MNVHSVILAAGLGKRMRSALPKVLHPVLGRPMILHAMEIVSGLTAEPPVLIIGHGSELVRARVGDRARFAFQGQQLGTAHALLQAAPLLRGQPDGLVLVTSADMPLLTPATLRSLVDTQAANPGPATIATVLADDSHGFGRVLRGPESQVLAIVEEAQATPEQLAIRELNVGAYCFASPWLWDALTRVQVSPKGEYYVTDLVEIAVRENRRVEAVVMDDPAEAIGVNTRVHLAEAERVMRERINQGWMEKGVTLIDPQSTYIDLDVQIGQDTTLWPGTVLRGSTVIGEQCEIGPYTTLEHTRVGRGSRVDVRVLRYTNLPEGSMMLQ